MLGRCVVKTRIFLTVSRRSIFLQASFFSALLLALAMSVSITSALCLGLAWLVVAWVAGKLKLLALYRWLSHEPGASIPSGSGLWDEVISLLYRQRRAHNHQVQMLTHALLTFRRAAQAMPDGVITLSSDNHILWCNETAIRMFGFNLPTDTGRPIGNLIRNPEFLLKLQTESNETSSKPVTIRSTHPEQKFFSIQLVRYGEGERLMLVRDITPLERLETMRRDFVANVSHELKSPLTVLSGFLETIQSHDELPTSQRRHFIDLMSEQALRMKRLVEDLLTLSSLESSEKAADTTSVSIDALLTKLETHARRLSNGQHTVNICWQRGVQLLGVDTELSSIFENLASNAIRYTPPGGQVDIEFDLTEDQSARFRVRDNGIGIEAQHIPRLTERFYRVDRGRSRDTGGTGLGLAIVKHALTRHEGSLHIESTYGQGTTMTAIFPARRTVAARSLTAA